MKKQHGGKRPNSGAKLKYGEPTKTISVRVPESKVNYFKNIITRLLEDMETKQHS